MCRLLMLLAMLMAGACSQGALVASCPPLVDYSKATQNRASEELTSMGARFPTVRRMITDYGKTRQAIRRCTEARKF